MLSTDSACTEIELVRRDSVESCDYALIEMIDYGSFGDIFKVKNEQDNTTYAMKEIKFRGKFQDDPFIMSEIYCLTHLKHKNIIALHEIIVDMDKIHFVMEYAVNESLEKYLSQNPDIEFHQKYKIFAQILQGINYCHSMDVAHRDLTPANVLVTEDMVIKLADFGLSVKCLTDDGSPMLCTDYIGHMCYLSPEVLNQKPFLPKPADIWSLGICLLYLLFLEVPYKGFLQEDVLEQQLNHSWKDFVAEKSARHELLEVIDNCLQEKPNERANICDLIRLLDEVSPEAMTAP